MQENRIKEIRARKNLTQKQLAEKAGTSQQQIQRIEAGVQDARFDLAARICEALGEPLERVFPSAAMPLRSARKKHSSAAEILADQAAADELQSAGLDMDAAQWTFAYRLRGGAEGALPVGARERDRLWKAVQMDDEEDFIVFDAEARRYAVNPEHLLSCQFLFDAPNRARTANEEDDEGRYSLEVILADSAEVQSFDVEPDEGSLDDEDDPDAKSVQLQDLFYYAQTDRDVRLKFEDTDGETAFFRTKDVAMFSVPLEAVEPKLLAATEDEAGPEGEAR